MLIGLSSPVLLAGDADSAYRDPAAIYHAGWFHLFFTLIRKEQDGQRYSYVASSKSRNLRDWTKPRTLTPADKRLDYSSPGNVMQLGHEWVMCLQTYPRPHGERYGTADSRIWTMRSQDLTQWAAPELLRVKGPETPQEAMGRMIDPFLLADKDQPNLFWCFYKQNGISISQSNDLVDWRFFGRTEAGENPCVILEDGKYVLFHSPPNGIGKKVSSDLAHWTDLGTTTLGQSGWAWAKGRITAGFVLDLRRDLTIRKALMFFHASRFPEEDPRGGFDNFASIGVAWSDDLISWSWPQ